MQYKKIVVGIDESYERTGISIAADGILQIVKSVDFKDCQNKAEKRIKLTRIICSILAKNKHKADEIIIIVERIRTFSQGAGKEKGFGLNPSYLKSIGALIGAIVDSAYLLGVPVYSVDTRAWKNKILGSSKTFDKYKKDFEKPEKAAAILFVKKLGFDVVERNSQGFVKIHERGKNAGKEFYDDDAADSACIALYGFADDQKLILEE